MIKPYNYGLASASYLDKGDVVIANNKLATVVKKRLKKNIDKGRRYTITFEVLELGDERINGWPISRATFKETVSGDHCYSYIFFIEEDQILGEEVIEK